MPMFVGLADQGALNDHRTTIARLASKKMGFPALRTDRSQRARRGRG